MSNRLVILDRDGVINFDSPDYIKSADEWVPIPGSLEAIARLHNAGFRIYVATNQAGIARGKLTEEGLGAIHAKLIEAVRTTGGEISGIEYCPHNPDARCGCRKPAPGMLHAIERASGTSVSGQYFVGDSLKDIRAAEAVNAQAVLVLTGNGADTNRTHHEGVLVYENLLAFAEDITNT